jgi:hypothetical protein
MSCEYAKFCLGLNANLFRSTSHNHEIFGCQSQQESLKNQIIHNGSNLYFKITGQVSGSNLKGKYKYGFKR